MESTRDIEKRFSEELEKLQERYREALEELIKENGMDKGVIRIKDGKEGVLLVVQDFYRRLGYEVKFYPFTKSGEVSQKSSGWSCSLSLSEFKPKGGD